MSWTKLVVIHWLYAKNIDVTHYSVGLHLFRQNSASGRQFEGCPCVRGGSWSRGSHPLHPQCWGGGPACGGEGYTLHPRAEGKPSNHNNSVLVHNIIKVSRSLSPVSRMKKVHLFSAAAFLAILVFRSTFSHLISPPFFTAVVRGSTREAEDCPRRHTHLQNGQRIPSKYLQAVAGR